MAQPPSHQPEEGGANYVYSCILKQLIAALHHPRGVQGPSNI